MIDDAWRGLTRWNGSPLRSLSLWRGLPLRRGLALWRGLVLRRGLPLWRSLLLRRRGARCRGWTRRRRSLALFVFLFLRIDAQRDHQRCESQHRSQLQKCLHDRILHHDHTDRSLINWRPHCAADLPRGVRSNLFKAAMARRVRWFGGLGEAIEPPPYSR